ncbi:LysE family translocator [Shimia ponticola]|uniref:LysE family translocator n=1 Tax=Shimia ponticola TaxID=2582893 RepID=UPI0011BD9AAB|nr:LysE family translocator [Shimia ponticola]
MVDLALFLAFLPAALALVLTPGPDTLFTMAQGLRAGRRAALAAAAGISTGNVINSALAGAGLGIIVSAAPWVFGIVRWIGVAYLLWLAWKTLRTPLAGANTRTIRPARAYRDGLIVNLSNPSAILFVLAFMPQFVDPTLAIFPQFLIFGVTLALLNFSVKAMVGASAGTVGPWLARNARIERGLRYVTAGIFGAIAARVAITGLRP